MKSSSIIILLLICYANTFSQQQTISADTFHFKQYHSSKDLVLRSDSTIYLHGRTFEFGKWQKKGDTIIVKKYRFLEADTASYNNDQNKVIISVLNCSYLPLPNQKVKFYQPKITRKTNKNGEITIEKGNFSGHINEYDISKFLHLGIRTVSIYNCDDDSLLIKSNDYNFDVYTFLIKETGLLDLSSNKLWIKR